MSDAKSFAKVLITKDRDFLIKKSYDSDADHYVMSLIFNIEAAECEMRYSFKTEASRNNAFDLITPKAALDVFELSMKSTGVNPDES